MPIGMGGTVQIAGPLVSHKALPAEAEHAVAPKDKNIK